MNKKLLIIGLFATLLALNTNVNAAENTTKTKPDFKNRPSKEQVIKAHKAREAAFEKKLGLSDKQKTQAKELRKKGHQQMEPIMKQLHTKKHEADILRLMRKSGTGNQERLTTLEKEIQDLEVQADTIRKQNMKEFESILTLRQKFILWQMKNEGRKNFEKNKRPLPPPPEFKK